MSNMGTKVIPHYKLVCITDSVNIHHHITRALTSKHNLGILWLIPSQGLVLRGCHLTLREGEETF